MLLSYLVKSAAVALALVAPVNMAIAGCPCENTDSDAESYIPNSNAETQQAPLEEQD
jgi:hypothetical protein